MGKKKWCFGREDVVCLTKDCPYMSECIQVVWQRKMARLLGKGAADGSGTVPVIKSAVKADEKRKRLAKKRLTSETPVEA